MEPRGTLFYATLLIEWNLFQIFIESLIYCIRTDARTKLTAGDNKLKFLIRFASLLLDRMMKRKSYKKSFHSSYFRLKLYSTRDIRGTKLINSLCWISKEKKKLLNFFHLSHALSSAGKKLRRECLFRAASDVLQAPSRWERVVGEKSEREERKKYVW